MEWLDTVHIKAFLKRQTLSKPYKKTSLYIACFDSYLKGYITKEQLLKTAEDLKKTDYGKYLFNLAKD